MNILVTGACGFIGRAFIHVLKETTHAVYGLDLECPEDFNTNDLTGFYKQDISREFVLETPFDFIFHLAACNLTHVGKVDYATYNMVNVQGTENLIKATSTKQFVFLSTTKVYEQQCGLIDETAKINPIGDYEKSKLQAENICQCYFKKDNLTILRSVNVVGPGQAEKAVIPVFLKKAFLNEPLKIIGSQKTILQLLCVRDLIKAFQLLLNEDKGKGIVNLCSEETIPLGDLAGLVIDICQSESRIHCFNVDEVPFSRINARKAQEVFGWRAEISVREMLSDSYKFYSKNR